MSVTHGETCKLYICTKAVATLLIINMLIGVTAQLGMCMQASA